MKLFLPELGSCFGGTPAVETITVEAPNPRKRRMRQGNGRKNWRPALTAIAEDGVVVREVKSHSADGFRSQKKPLLKSIQFVGKNRSDSYGSDYMNSGHSMALPAFSPTPFVF